MRKFTFIFFTIIYAGTILANESSQSIASNNSALLISLAIMLSLAILSTSINKIGQPAVLGQITIGCMIGILIHYNIPFFINIAHSQTIIFLAELGSIFAKVKPVGAISAGVGSKIAGSTFSKGLKGYYQGERIAKHALKNGMKPEGFVKNWFINFWARADRRNSFRIKQYCCSNILECNTLYLISCIRL